MKVWSMPDGYAEVCQYALDEGETVEDARLGGERSRTKELLGFSFEMEKPELALPVGTGRKLNVAVGAVEALQLIGGWSDPALACRVAPNMAAYMNAGIFHGAYGPRIASQLPEVVRRLRCDSTSRQAIVTIWQPLMDMQDGPRDLPCTITLQWLIRNDLLYAIAYMRSNDAWWGLAYDVFQFTQLQITLARFLEVGIGTYHHHCGSFHAYERDWDAIDGLIMAPASVVHPSVADGLWAAGDDDWQQIRERTRAVVAPGGDGDTGSWYRDVMAKYV